MKDLFSRQADGYARFRPVYPAPMFEFLAEQLPARHRAWDCATGNGQLAVGLADIFDHVDATDISERQLSQAVSNPHITYSLQPAENTTFPDGVFDLVTVAQAVHWFDLDRFYAEVKRTLRPDGLLALIGYEFPLVNEAVDRVIREFYEGPLGPYWDPERKLIDLRYRTLSFPFREMETPGFVSEHDWSADHFIGFVESWSAVQHYVREKGKNPVDLVRDEIRKHWPHEKSKPVRFPVFLRAGRNS